MANAEPLPMDPDFAHWHDSIGIGDDQSRRLSRWTGVSGVVQAVDRKGIEALVRLAFKSRQTASGVLVQKFREAFRAADATFEMQGNDRELQVLAAASLAVAMRKGSNAGAAAALAVTTASLGGARKPDLPMDLCVLAEAAIDRIAETNRNRSNLTSYTSTDAPKFDFEKAAAKAKAEPNGDGFAQAFTLATESARTAFAQLARRQANAVNAMDRFLRAQDEELQMLWWLIGRRSVDLDTNFEALPADAQSLIFAKELADNTEFLPGPASVKALLSRAGLKDRKKITMPAAINAAHTEWLKSFASEEEYSPVSAPIHFGIKRQLETGTGDAWIPGWAAAVGVADKFAVSALTLGVLFYRERLLLLFDGE